MVAVHTTENGSETDGQLGQVTTQNEMGAGMSDRQAQTQAGNQAGGAV
jgi:hypothetical protein